MFEVSRKVVIHCLCFLVCLVIAACSDSRRDTRQRFRSTRRTPAISPRHSQPATQNTALLFAGAGNVFRLAAAVDAAAAVDSWGSQRFQKKWDRLIAPMFASTPDQLHDFFSGAIVLEGRANAERCIVLFFNPWSDGLLFVALSKGDAKPQCDDFFFVSGELWRGDPIKTTADILQRCSTGSSLIRSLASVYERTVVLFGKRFHANAPFTFDSSLMIPKGSTEEENLALIKARLTVRMGMYLALFSDSSAGTRALIRDARKLLKSGSTADWLSVLPKERVTGVMNAVYDLPQIVREKMSPVYFWRHDERSAVALVSPHAPRWFLLVEIKHNEDAPEFERLSLFDFELSDELRALESKP